MNKEEIFDLVPFYVSGKLSEDEQQTFVKELGKNDELKKEVSFWKAMKSAAILHNKIEEEQHPSIDEIVAYVKGELIDEDNKYVKIKEHLGSCEICNEDATAVRTLYPHDGWWRKILVFFDKSLETFSEYSEKTVQIFSYKPIRLAYVTASLLILIVGTTYILRYMRTSTTDNIVHLSYDVANRSPEKPPIYQRFIVSREKTIITFDVSVPKSDIPTLQFSYRLEVDSGKIVLIHGTTILSYRATNDSLWFNINLDSQIFSVNHGPYILYIVNRLTSSDEILYDYPFEIKFE
jgi:hypothetical protein